MSRSWTCIPNSRAMCNFRSWRWHKGDPDPAHIATRQRSQEMEQTRGAPLNLRSSGLPSMLEALFVPSSFEVPRKALTSSQVCSPLSDQSVFLVLRLVLINFIKVYHAKNNPFSLFFAAGFVVVNSRVVFLFSCEARRGYASHSVNMVLSPPPFSIILVAIHVLVEAAGGAAGRAIWWLFMLCLSAYLPFYVDGSASMEGGLGHTRNGSSGCHSGASFGVGS